MLSRRNIRIKVMQMLYSINRDEQLTPKAALAGYHQNIQAAFEVYLYNLYLLSQITKLATKDQERRLVKHLPTEEDKHFTDRLTTNSLSQSLIKNHPLTVLSSKHQFKQITDHDNIRKLYQDFIKKEEHKTYQAAEDIPETHRQVLLKLYKHCTSSELFNEMIEDRYTNWTDDKSLVIGTMKKTIKALPSEENFLNHYRPADDTVLEFGEVLLKKVSEDDQELLDQIEPTLKNWDADRVAVLDMILLKMALAELLIFPTIPTKVTLNEFVEIAKLYSTDKSKDFINGILDRLMKQLEKEGKIKKQGRGLKD